MDYHPGASTPFPLDEGQLRSILATENGRKLLLLLQKTDPAALRDAAKAAKRAIMSPCSGFWGRFYSRRRRTPSSGAGRKPWTICNLRSSSCSPIRSSSRSWPRWRQRSGCIRPRAARRPSRRRNRRNWKIKAARCAAAAGRAKAAHAPERPAGKAADGTAAFLEAGAPGKSFDRALRIAQLTQLAGSAFSGHKHL